VLPGDVLRLGPNLDRWVVVDNLCDAVDTQSAIRWGENSGPREAQLTSWIDESMNSLKESSCCRTRPLSSKYAWMTCQSTRHNEADSTKMLAHAIPRMFESTLTASRASHDKKGAGCEEGMVDGGRCRGCSAARRNARRAACQVSSWKISSSSWSSSSGEAGSWSVSRQPRAPAGHRSSAAQQAA
jgi:hypothetical protein